MAGWNLALRFGLEVAALVGLGAGAWSAASGVLRVVLVVVVPLVAAVAWATFNVLGDPSRSGEAPVEVAGPVRLALELAILVGGVVGLAIAGWTVVAVVVGALLTLHYATTGPRLRWLLPR